MPFYKRFLHAFVGWINYQSTKGVLRCVLHTSNRPFVLTRVQPRQQNQQPRHKRTMTVTPHLIKRVGRLQYSFRSTITRRPSLKTGTLLFLAGTCLHFIAATNEIRFYLNYLIKPEEKSHSRYRPIENTFEQKRSMSFSKNKSNLLVKTCRESLMAKVEN